VGEVTNGRRTRPDRTGLRLLDISPFIDFLPVAFEERPLPGLLPFGWKRTVTAYSGACAVVATDLSHPLNGATTRVCPASPWWRRLMSLRPMTPGGRALSLRDHTELSWSR
jgi:hypothetical protein